MCGGVRHNNRFSLASYVGHRCSRRQVVPDGVRRLFAELDDSVIRPQTTRDNGIFFCFVIFELWRSERFVY